LGEFLEGGDRRTAAASALIDFDAEQLGELAALIDDQAKAGGRTATDLWRALAHIWIAADCSDAVGFAMAGCRVRRELPVLQRLGTTCDSDCN
jgi:hypothetical protein